MAQFATEGLSVNNPLFRVYAFYSSLLVLKMLCVALLTTATRLKNKAVCSPEDTLFKTKLRIDEGVERVRRTHLNALENIPIFLVVSLIYILTNPSYFFATLLFRVFTLARFTHTFVYAIVVIPQPTRALAFFAGVLVTGYMALHNLIYFLG